MEGDLCHLRDQTGGGRTLKVVFEDGSTTTIETQPAGNTLTLA